MAKASSFGKPQAATGAGTFAFQMPETLGQGRGRIPAGKYIGRCTDIVAENSKSSGNPMWTWTFVITKGPRAGRDFKLWTVLTDDAAWKIAETLTALGIKAEAGDELNISRRDVIGVGVTMHVIDDSGKDGNSVDDAGNPMYSKLDKISAHPEGAGHRPGKLGQAVDEDDDRDYPKEFDEGKEEEEEEEEEEELPAPPARRAQPVPAKRGKAPASLGKRRH